ncbi:OpgC domain-containing protein [Silvibacterium dinghuense]|uniref:OpgC domain-containing protein n=1 Tax=Silvibacterium dinghuense TaxID=1560006 RepID=A0A4Q1SEB8_9BACT|nr:OpgC domain-containing protein [Silvibacterium dinghuense]RXS95602.1 OpgC domain-containing protein [Silvibacterium dinghuense]GGH14321.1 membrane protein [Silvibacterium dinghuense]
MSLHLPKHLPKLERRPELDALRGLFLVWMTLTHLPTRFADFVNQPIGYVSSAEGFVFLSALLVGRLYIRDLIHDAPGVRAKLWKRSLKIYGYHLLMLAFAFTIAAALAVHTHKAALMNLLDFYLAHPVEAIVGSVLLIYCPPLLDILPMYVTFLFFTPLLLSGAVRWGWKKILAASGLIWLLAQFGLREAVHGAIVSITHLEIPLQETGAFNMFAWQAVWIAGLYLGAKSAVGEIPLKRIPGWAVGVAAAVCLFFIGVRHGWLGPHLTQQALGLKLDKWQIGWLRVLNLICFTTVFYWLRKYVVRIVSIEPFLTLGKASLQVFCAHLFFVFVGLTLLYGEVEQLQGITAITLIIATFAALMWVASNEVRKKRRKREKRQQKNDAAKREHVLPPAAKAMACAEQQP